MNAGNSIVERVSLRDVFRSIGIAVPDDPRKLARCVYHDDNTPSMRVFQRGCVCFGCGFRSGTLGAIVALGLASTNAEAARFLEERFR
jgi:hypothetical protein